MKLIIQVPCYNEAETLTIALNALPKHIDGIDEIEYLVIDDGSKDDTERVAREWGVNYIVKQRRTGGQDMLSTDKLKNKEVINLISVLKMALTL